MSKQTKSEVKVQKQTQSKSIQFQPNVLHKCKTHKQHSQSYITSFKRIIQNKLFNKDHQSSSDTRLSSRVLSSQKDGKLNKNNNQSNQKIRVNSNQKKNRSSIQQRRSTQSALLQYQRNIIDKTKQESTIQLDEFSTILEKNYLKIKYLKRMSVDCVLIGNQNQLDLIQFKIENELPKDQKLWPLSLDKPIDGVTTSRLAESKILLWADNQLFIYQCNPKNLVQPPHLIQKITASCQTILSVQFVKRNIFLICCRSHIQIYEIMEINKDLTINKLETKTFNCPKNFQVIQIPEHYDNNIKIFFANMHEYDEPEGQKNEKQKQKQSSGGMFGNSKKPKTKDVFGLYYVQVQYDYNMTKVNELKKVYQIKKNLRYQIKLLNVSSNIFFMSLKTQVLAVKNGLIIDSVGVNFKFDNCYLKIIKNDVLVHILTDKIEFYKLTLNYDCLPQKIMVSPFDSIYFPRDLADQFLSIVPINQGYSIFFQTNLKKHSIEQLEKGSFSYWYGLTYPVPLQEKLNQIFPSTQKIAQTSLDALQTLCDMAGKMGLTLNQSYRQLWKKSKKQTEKDYEILLLSRDYQIIQQQITLLLKKKAQKLRLISKNQKICLEFLRARVFQYSCSLENLQQFSYCHFFNTKLNTYQHMQVQRKRFEMDVYKKGKQIGANQINKIMGILTPNRQIKQQPDQSQSQIQIPHEHLFNQQDSQILSQHFNQQMRNFVQHQQMLNKKVQPTVLDSLRQPNLFATNLKTSKHYTQIQQDRKNSQLREREKLMHQVENRLKQPDYNQIKINIKDYYFYRDCNLKQLFLEIVTQLMIKQHTFHDHLKYFNLRVLVRNFKLCFRGLYQDILCQLISTYKHKISRLLEHFLQLLPFEFQTLPSDTQASLCQSIWNPLQSQQFEQCLFLSDITTIQNRQTIIKFQQSLWFKRNNLTHHGVITATKQEMKTKYSAQNMKNIKDHYFYLFISKFLQIKNNLKKQMKSIQQLYPTNNNVITMFSIPIIIDKNDKNDDTKDDKEDNIDKDDKTDKADKKIDKRAEAIAKVQKQLLKTDELITRVQQIYPLIPEHLKGFIDLYFDLYNFLEEFNCQQKNYSSIYEFLKLKDFQLFKIFFTIEKKTKGFIIKQILEKYIDTNIVKKNGRQKFIQGIQHYFDSDLSQITDLKTILNRLNGQTRQFHIKFQGLYDCLLSAIMKKIKISPNTSVKLDELLIYVQNIPFSTANGKIFEKLLLIQQVHLQMQILKRSKIQMSILQIKNNPQVVIGALVQSQLKSQNLIAGQCILDLMNPTSKQSQYGQLRDQQCTNVLANFFVNINYINQIHIQSVDQLKMYFWKCLSQLMCIKRHFYGNQYQHLLGFIFLTQLLEYQHLVPMIWQALQDPQIKQLLSFLIPQHNQQQHNLSQQQQKHILQQQKKFKKFKKALVYYSYKRRLSKFPARYLQSQSYLKKLLHFLSKSDGQRQLIQLELKYCHIFKKCKYDMPYPLSFNQRIPILDQIQYHIRQINSSQIDQLDVDKLFEVIQSMRQLIQPCLDITYKTLTDRIKQFEKILYQFVFFKYLRQRKIQLALDMIKKLIELNPKENCIIYCAFIIDVMIQQFSDTTGDLIIKLISYFYHSANQLTLLLQELIFIKFTTNQFENYIHQKINHKIKSNSQIYFDSQNYIFSDQVKKLTSQPLDQTQKLNLCSLFDAVYKHLQKSSQYIQKKRFFQIIYRLMLFNPYQAAQFLYSKQKQINIKALRAFFSFMSQQFLFNPQIVLRVGTYVFIIILQRMKDNFMISQQIKQYTTLNLDFQTFDESSFQTKFSNISSLSPMQKLVYKSYQGMKKKSQGLTKYSIFPAIQKQLQRVKLIYDEDSFVVKKNNIQNMQKHHEVSYLKYQDWLKESKLKYYLHNINQFSSYGCYSYLYTKIDEDDTYTTKGVDQFISPRIEAWPDKVQFDKLQQRRQILVLGKYTRIPDRHQDYQKQSVVDNNMLSMDTPKVRCRKPSVYLPQQYVLQKKSTTNLHNYNSMSGHMQKNTSKGSLNTQQADNGQLIRKTFSNEYQQVMKDDYKFVVQGPVIKQNKGDNAKVENPILNFFGNGSIFMK